MKYFSDEDYLNKGNTTFKITINIWNGIVAVINALMNNNLLAKDFPKKCPDGNGIGVDEESFYVAVIL